MRLSVLLSINCLKEPGTVTPIYRCMYASIEMVTRLTRTLAKEEVNCLTTCKLHRAEPGHGVRVIWQRTSPFDTPKQRMEYLDRLFGSLDLEGEEEEVYLSSDRPDHCVCKGRRHSDSDPCKVFGDFQCVCGKTWRSGNCWFKHTTGELYTQNCKRCRTKNEPKTFRACRSSGPENSKGPHQVALCARCKELGRDCSQK